MISAMPAVPLPAGFLAYTGQAGLRPDGDDSPSRCRRGPTSAPGCSPEPLRRAERHPEPAAGRLRAGPGRWWSSPRTPTWPPGPRATGTPRRSRQPWRRQSASRPEEVLIASTGRHRPALPDGSAPRPPGRPAPGPVRRRRPQVARAMMTTDTVPKTAVQRAGPARVVGMAKGVGMIEPDMATMLAFVLTDAAVDAADLAPSCGGGPCRRHVQLPEHRHRHLHLRHRRGAGQRGGRAGERGGPGRGAARGVPGPDLAAGPRRRGGHQAAHRHRPVGRRRRPRPSGWPRPSSTRRS